MSDRNGTSVDLSIGGGTLFVVFLVLKLTHVIDWSWWWVTCPLWIGPAFVLAVLAAFSVVGLIALCVVGLIALVMG